MSGLKRIVAHWDVGRGEFNGSANAHYHFFADKHGVVYECAHRPEDNLNCRDGRYAAHVRHCNSGTIGVCAGGMFGARGETRLGPYPVTRAAWDAMCKKTAELCQKYDIPVTPRTVLTHAEVETTLGKKQRGKWDYTVLPFEPSVRGHRACGDRFRSDVRRFMGQTGFVRPKEAPQTLPGRNRNRYLQKLLVRVGYPVGDLDGWIGAKTKKAVQEFCRDYGLEYDPDNPLSKPVVAELRKQEIAMVSRPSAVADALARDVGADGRMSTTNVAQTLTFASGTGMPLLTFLRDSMPEMIFTGMIVVMFAGVVGGVIWTLKERGRHKANARRAQYLLDDLASEAEMLG